MHLELKWRLLRFAITAVSMFAVWLIFTASLETFSLVTGIIGSLLIGGLTYDVFIPRHQAGINYFVPRPFYLIKYLILMIFYIYKSSFKMLSAVITGDVNPRIVHFRTALRSDMSRMVLANSITITPGTITLDLNDDHLTVHWFFSTTSHSKVASENVKGQMEKHLGKVWL